MAGAELFHQNRQTDMTKLMVVFDIFANVPKSTKLTLFLIMHHSIKPHSIRYS